MARHQDCMGWFAAANLDCWQIRLGQRVIAGVVAERAFVAERLARANVAFDDEVGLPCRSLVRRQALGKTVFNSGKMSS